MAASGSITAAQLVQLSGLTERRLRELAKRLRAETTMTVGWVAARLHMGSRHYVSELLHSRPRRKSKQGNNPQN